MPWMTCLMDGRHHAVAEPYLVAGLAEGRYLAACGLRVTPGSMFSPPGRRCMSCHVLVTARTSQPPGRRQWWRAATRPPDE
ncbi:hypothetical protein [Pseudonocardia spinosispora]|uniref:hypothetical protein n=1 Tax=Pseudonocardia spinosispora TaxID=103441 RepID=UPI0003F70D4B|nr:hypothetical protein [Pseudonocardia spinosispora]